MSTRYYRRPRITVVDGIYFVDHGTRRYVFGSFSSAISWANKLASR